MLEAVINKLEWNASRRNSFEVFVHKLFFSEDVTDTGNNALGGAMRKISCWCLGSMKISARRPQLRNTPYNVEHMDHAKESLREHFKTE